MIQYKIVNGSIPEGSRVISDRGVMKITGVAPLDASFNPPVFSGDNKLPNADEFDVIDIALNITPQNGKNLIGSTVIRGTMPWGLVLDGLNVSGTVAELNTRVAVDFSEEEAPKWSTRSGPIGDFGEMDTVSNVVLITEEPTTMRVIKGQMPWGLTMAPNGVISGKVFELNNPKDVEAGGPGPLFDTARGRLGDFSELETIPPINIVAVPRTGANVYLRVVKGILPWGLAMSKNGTINGSICELTNGGPSENPAEAFKPTVTPRPLSATVGSPSSQTILATVPNGRTLLSLNITNGYLPVGLVLQGNTISGTPISVGTYSFDIVATDSDLIKSTPTSFTFEVIA